MRVDMYTERYYEFEEPYNGATVTIVLKTVYHKCMNMNIKMYTTL